MVFRNGESKAVSDEDAITLLTNPNFIDSQTGKNPNFCCVICGEVSYSESFMGPRLDVISYRDDSGRLLCVSHFLVQHPEWQQWHEIMSRRGQPEPATESPEPEEVFIRVATAPIDLTPDLPQSRAQYTIGNTAVEGNCTIKYSETLQISVSFETTLDDKRRVERRFTPGQFVHESSIASIVSLDDAWRANGAIAWTQGENHRRGCESTGHIVANIEELLIPANPRGDQECHLRWVIRGELPQGQWRWRNSFIQVNLIKRLGPIDSAASSVLIFGRPFLPEQESDGLWNTLCFLAGRNVQVLATEIYDKEGALIQQVHRRGKPENNEKVAPFSHSGMDVTSAQVGNIHEAFTRMHELGFNISRILDHVLFSAKGHMDHEALHLLIAVHTLMREWTDYWKRRSSTGDQLAQMTRRRHKERGHIIKQRCYKPVAEQLMGRMKELLDGFDIEVRLKSSILRGLENANELSMAERLFQVLEDDLGMALEDDDRRALGYRNELTHEGGFARDFIDLSYDERNLRLEDVGRLRNIVTEAILRLCGYNGVVDDFMLPGGRRIINGSLPSPFLEQP